MEPPAWTRIMPTVLSRLRSSSASSCGRYCFLEPNSVDFFAGDPWSHENMMISSRKSGLAKQSWDILANPHHSGNNSFIASGLWRHSWRFVPRPESSCFCQGAKIKSHHATNKAGERHSQSGRRKAGPRASQPGFDYARGVSAGAVIGRGRERERGGGAVGPAGQGRLLDHLPGKTGGK